MSEYLESFLTKPRWWTSDTKRVEDSIAIWFDWDTYGDEVEDEDIRQTCEKIEERVGDRQDRYSLSWLGVINGVLCRLPSSPVLVCELNDDTLEIEEWYFRSKWW